jgi:hypothetical protein
MVQGWSTWFVLGMMLINTVYNPEFATRGWLPDMEKQVSLRLCGVGIGCGTIFVPDTPNTSVQQGALYKRVEQPQIWPRICT